MNRVENWRPAASIAAACFDEASLLAWFDRVDPTPLIRRGLPMISAPAWDPEGLVALFGLDNPNHCFRVAPHRWATFHEPQITRGFAHFLDIGSRRQRLARAIAFVKAAAVCAGEDPSDVDRFAATSVRCVAEENRTDILIELRHGDQRIGASVEAKFGHRLTRGQLPKALSYAQDERRWTMERSVLIVVAPSDPSTTRMLRRNSRWRGTSWWSLLRSIEDLTDAETDDEDYRRFRRTVWHRAY